MFMIVLGMFRQFPPTLEMSCLLGPLVLIGFARLFGGNTMAVITISRRSFIATGLAAGAAAVFVPAFAQSAMTAEKMQSLIDYTLRRNKEDNKSPTRFSERMTPIIFGRADEVLVLQIGNDEGALKERFSVTVNQNQQQVILFSRTDEQVYFHLTGVHLRREVSAINRKEGGSLWAAPDAAQDFVRQMTYWAGQPSPSS